MSKIPRIHYYKDRRHLINTYYLALLPLIIFSIYKNGILLYTNNLINFSHILIPLYFYIISIIISILISLIFIGIQTTPYYNKIFDFDIKN